MRRYETITIIDPDVSEENRVELCRRITDLMPQYDGFLILQDDWGNRKLAYEIKKKNRGYYVRFDYCGDGALVDEMERNFRIEDRFLKYMTVLLEKEADVEAIKAQMAEEEKAEEETEAAEPAEASEKDAPVEAETAPAEAPEPTSETESTGKEEE